MRLPSTIVKKETAEDKKEVKAKVVKAKETKALPMPVGIEIDTTGEISVGRMIIIDKEMAVPTKDTLIKSMGCKEEDVDYLIKSVEDINEEIKKKVLIGKVILIEGDYLTVDLNKEYPFTLSLNDVVTYKNTFLLIPKENVSLIKQSEDEKEHGVLYEFFSKGKLDTIQEESGNIINLKSNINNNERQIKDYVENINRYKQSIVRDMLLVKRKSEELEKAIEGTETDNSEVYYKNIFKNPDVKSLDLLTYSGQTCLLLTTNELEYTSNKRDLKFMIGGYKVLFLPNGSIMVSNYTKHYASGQYHHPCVESSFGVCMGGAFKSALSNTIQARDYASAIHMTIDFLKAPNYGGPYIEDVNLISMQPINKEPSSELDWFSRSFFEKQSWSDSTYREEQSKALAKVGAVIENDNDDNDDEDEDYDDED